jgi:hypothetical protein
VDTSSITCSFSYLYLRKRMNIWSISNLMKYEKLRQYITKLRTCRLQD